MRPVTGATDQRKSGKVGHKRGVKLFAVPHFFIISGALLFLSTFVNCDRYTAETDRTFFGDETQKVYLI